MTMLELMGIENSLTLRILASLFLISAGVLIGRLITYFLEKVIDKLDISKKVSASFVGLSVAVLRWCIYIGFFILALDELQIPTVTHFITRGLVTIPAVTSALLLIAVGFTLAVYLRNVIEDSEVTGWRILSQIIFYFVLYIFLTYALSIALLPLDPLIRNTIIVALTIIVATALSVIVVKKELRESHLHR